jgi:hypothetical protein
MTFRHSTSSVLAACLVGHLVACLTAAPACATEAVSDRLVPAQGAWWGIYAPANAGIGWDYTAALTALESRVGRTFDVVHRYHDMSTAGYNGVFPDPYEKAQAAGGRIPFFAWESRTFSGGINYTWAQIANGSMDAVVDATADRIHALPYRVFIDFDHEPEGHTTDGPDADFVAAYRHVVDRFRARGASNAVWVWTIMGWSGAYSRYAGLYPGDGYVDWVAFDPYNWNGWGGHSGWRSFNDSVRPFYDWLAANSAPGHAYSSKPYMLSEFGSADDPADAQRRADWYRAVPAALKTMPNIRSVVYFDSSTDADWRFETTAASIAGFADAGHDPYLNQPHSGTVTGDVAPTIAAQPASLTVDAGQTATFTVSASGSPTPTCQWRRNGAAIAGATAASYTTPPTTSGDNGAVFSCVVANRAGSVTSSGATLTVVPTVVIGSGTGLSAVYFDNQDLTGAAVLRTDPTIDFAWAGTASPVAGIAPGTYSVRWSGQVQAQVTQTYTFHATADDGVRLWVDGRLLIDRWIDQPATEYSGSIALNAGARYDIALEYYQAGGDTRIALAWSGPATAKQIVPATQLYPATVPGPWSAGDLGSGTLAGSGYASGDTVVLTGAGADIWGTADGGRFMGQPLSGDGTIVARVVSLQDTDPWAKAGVMIRESTAAGARHAFCCVTPGNGVAFQRRTVAGAVSAHTAGSRSTAPRWVKLVRAGTTITGYESPDGAAWTVVGSTTIAFGAPVQIGLAVTSHNAAVLCTAVFADLQVIPAAAN